MKRDIIRKSKRSLKILRTNGFREPFQILVDNSFINVANKSRLALSTVSKIFKSEPKLFMTKCTYEIHKPNLIEKDFSGVCEIIKCGHETHTKECAHEFIKEANPNHYILATGLECISRKFKSSKHIPVLRLFRSQLIIQCSDLDLKKNITVDSKALRNEVRRLKKIFGSE